MDNVPHLALPLRIVGDRFVAVQQDTLDELISTVAAITSFPVNYRVERPDFGIVPPEFDMRPVDTLDVEQAVEAFEPRALVNVVEQPYDPRDPGADRLRVEVSMPRAQEGNT
jgi:phage baseplate assembly protein W